VRAFNHPLVDCGVTFLPPAKLAHLRKGFPASLDGAPVLLPAAGTAIRRGLESWFEARAVHRLGVCARPSVGIDSQATPTAGRGAHVPSDLDREGRGRPVGAS
jgi:hypothetical protein